MDSMRQYLMSVVTAAMLCGLAQSMVKKGAAQNVIKLVAGIFLAFTVLKPIATLDITALSDLTLTYSSEASEAAQAGEEFARSSAAGIIKSETEAYILDKALALNAQLQVDVSVSGDPIPVPIAVRLTGDVSPYVKLCLEQMLEEELGIPKEAQTWNGS